MLNPESRRGSSAAAAEDVVTGDMVSQHAYCPRRLYLAYAEGRWADNAFTDHGRWVHRHAESREDVLPSPADPDAPRVARSVELVCEARGVRAKLDLLERDRDASALCIPVEIKRGALPASGQPYSPERQQLGLQAVLLRANGYQCEHGVIYYAASRRRVEVPIDASLVAEVEAAIDAVRTVLSAPDAPEPLVDSPKCPSCSLVGICLPDETQLLRLRRDKHDESTNTDPLPRRLVAPKDDALPFYVQEPGAQVGKKGECLTVSKRGEPLAEVRILDVSQLVLCGNIAVTAPAIALLCEAGIPIVHLSMGHWFYGVTHGLGLRNAFDRAAQFATAADPSRSLEIARAMVQAKGRNQRTLLRRNGPSEAPVLEALRGAIDDIERADSVEALLGMEGRVAALYFQDFASMLRPRHGEDALSAFDFQGRNRRPPRDPVNAMLSFGYALLAKEATVALLTVGLDPYWGVYHRPRHGRASLALDMMEEFRPLIVDSAVLSAINTGVVDATSFEMGASGCALNTRGRKAFISAYEARMDQLVTHPLFGYRVSWRRVLSLQAQLLARVFRGELDRYPAITTR
ncbi:MAG: CRISPR-associated endonuclease Cas1 [Myxococcales bacterium]|nr:CRISPR-associated endonuclease Cas1 [Myxococcales bacterium]